MSVPFIKSVLEELEENRKLSNQLRAEKDDDILQRLERLNQRIAEQQARQNALVTVAVFGLLSIAGIFAGSLLWL